MPSAGYFSAQQAAPPLADISRSSIRELKVQPLQQSETQQAVENQERRYDEVEETRHDQDRRTGVSTI
jgi:hypothetical protein